MDDKQSGELLILKHSDGTEKLIFSAHSQQTPEIAFSDTDYTPFHLRPAPRQHSLRTNWNHALALAGYYAVIALSLFVVGRAVYAIFELMCNKM